MCSTLRPELLMHVEVMQRRIDWAAGLLLRAQRQRIFSVAANGVFGATRLHSVALILLH